MKTRTFLKSMVLPLACPIGQGWAQGNSRPIRVVLPLPAGSFSDFVARLICRGASPLLGQPMVVDNKPGANGVIGVMEVVRAAPDGYTLLCGSIANLAATVAVVKNLPYDPRRDVTPIAAANVAAQIIVVKAGSPIRTLADFIAFAKQNPRKLSYGYASAIVRLQFETLARKAGIELLAVPYKGAPAAVQDVIGGVLDATLEAPASTLPQVNAGHLRALAVTTRRNPLFPDLPSVGETLPEYDFPLWNAFVGPPGMPRDVVQRLSTAFLQAQRQPDVAQQLLTAGAPALSLDSDQLKAFIDTEVSKYVSLAKQVGIEPE